MLSLAEEVERYLAAVEAIREEGSPDFLRFATARDKARETRADKGTVADRIGRYTGSQRLSQM